MSEPIDSGNGRVSYTVKELLQKIDAKMDMFAVGLDAKTNIEEHNRLAARVEKLENSAADADAVEAYRKQADATAKSQRRWIIGLVVTVLVAVLGLATQAIYSLFQ